MNNRGYVAVAVIVAMLVTAAGGSYWYLTTSPTRDAFLNIESGEVEVDQGSGWTSAVDNMDLSLSDKVRTLSGEAVIVLYESIIIALDSDTVVELANLAKEHIKVDHSAGSAWHKFTGLTGITAFSVETPNTVATVRGTEFGTGMEEIIVAEGQVEITDKDGNKIIIKAGEKYVFEDGDWVKTPLTEEERESIQDRMRKTISRLQKLRLAEMNKKPLLYNQVKNMYDLTDQDVLNLLAAVDDGEYDLDELEAKSPIKSEVVTKLRGLTEKIIEQKQLLKDLETNE